MLTSPIVKLNLTENGAKYTVTILVCGLWTVNTNAILCGNVGKAQQQLRKCEHGSRKTYSAILNILIAIDR